MRQSIDVIDADGFHLTPVDLDGQLWYFV